MKSHHKILIVDDNPTNVEILEEILEEYDLRSASNGEDALEIAKTYLPDIILLDIMMPGMDGYEVCRQIRGLQGLRYTKVIMVSAKAMLSERLQGYEVGADDYITKPFDEELLAAKIRVYLRLKSVEEVDKLKGDFLMLMSHEAYTPLTSIIWPVETLIEDKDIDEAERQKWLRMIHDGAKRLNSLFDNVIMLCALKSGKFDFHFENADLCSAIRDARERVMGLANDKKISVSTDLPSPTICRHDRKQITRVFETILDNAIRHGHAETDVVVAMHETDDAVNVSIQNSGKGIDPDYFPHIFNEFSETHMKIHAEGRGLSLAVAYQLIISHNGGINVENQEFKTIFSVVIPKDPGHADMPAESMFLD